MAKKYQRRTNIADRRKKEEAAKLAKRQAYWAANKKSIITWVIIAVVVIVAAAFAIDYFVCPNGTIRNFMGHNVDVEENWIVRNLGTTKNPAYYKFGTMDTPAGYEASDSGLSKSDTQEKDFCFKPAEDSDGLFRTLYVVGVKNKKGAEMIESIWAAGKPKDEEEEAAAQEQAYVTYIDMTEPAAMSLAGQDAVYVTYCTQMLDDDGNAVEGMFDRCVIAYVDTVQNSSILFNGVSQYAPMEELPSADELLAELESMMGGFTVEK